MGADDSAPFVVFRRTGCAPVLRSADPRRRAQQATAARSTGPPVPARIVAAARTGVAAGIVGRRWRASRAGADHQRDRAALDRRAARARLGDGAGGALRRHLLVARGDAEAGALDPLGGIVHGLA